MKATFIGVPGEEHDTINMYGQEFPLGKAVRVESRQAMRKLQGHPHFKVEAEPSDNAEDATIRREFTAATDASLADVQARNAAEEARAAEASTMAARAATPVPPPATPNLSNPNPETVDGDANGARDQDSAKDQGRRAAPSSKR